MSRLATRQRTNRLAIGALVCAALGGSSVSSMAQSGSTAAPATVRVPATARERTGANADDIVRKLMQQNQRRADHLKGYTERREYTVVYQGITSLKASMTVEARYEAPTQKQFQILSQNGPNLLVDRVLKKLLESEQEATKNPDQTALTPVNYTFSLLGEEKVAGRQCYLLHVEPRVASKFLYQGTIFVDAKDYAVVQIEAKPARNPSFWIGKTNIHHTYSKTGQFWLPEHDRTQGAVRIGGTAVLTIDYGPYHVQGLSVP